MNSPPPKLYYLPSRFEALGQIEIELTLIGINDRSPGTSVGEPGKAWLIKSHSSVGSFPMVRKAKQV